MKDSRKAKEPYHVMMINVIIVSLRDRHDTGVTNLKTCNYIGLLKDPSLYDSVAVGWE